VAEDQQPIDAVYTWVDGSDPAWRERKRGRLAGLGADAAQLDASATSDARFLSRDELRYSLRSLERYAPFIRKVHIVTDRQIPSWLDTACPRLQLVFHDDLFPDGSHLPTFSSQAIESHLHRIPGLAERFVYFNDDILLWRPLTPDDFFDEAGRIRVYLDRREVEWNASEPQFDVGVNAAARASSRLIEDMGAPRIRKRVDHTPYALRKSLLEELWRRFPSELEAVSSQPFRHPRTVTLTSCLAQYYALHTGEATSTEEQELRYLKVKKKHLWTPAVLAHRLAKTAREPERTKFLSINDAGELDRSWVTAAAIAAFFRFTYRGRSAFERPGRRLAQSSRVVLAEERL
jgi:hypothetical protein